VGPICAWLGPQDPSCWILHGLCGSLSPSIHQGRRKGESQTRGVLVSCTKYRSRACCRVPDSPQAEAAVSTYRAPCDLCNFQKSLLHPFKCGLDFHKTTTGPSMSITAESLIQTFRESKPHSKGYMVHGRGEKFHASWTGCPHPIPRFQTYTDTWLWPNGSNVEPVPYVTAQSGFSIVPKPP
jgi:hypothetical protein